jgi:hypothetical protein
MKQSLQINPLPVRLKGVHLLEEYAEKEANGKRITVYKPKGGARLLSSHKNGKPDKEVKTIILVPGIAAITILQTIEEEV